MALEHTSFYVDISDFSRQLRKLQIPGGGENATDTDMWGLGWARLWIDDPDKPGKYYDQVRSPRTLNATTSPPRVEQVNTWQEWAAADKRISIRAEAKEQIPNWTIVDVTKEPLRDLDIVNGAARWHSMNTALAATLDADLDTFDNNLDNYDPDPAFLKLHLLPMSGVDWAVGSIQMSILATPPGPLWRLADGSDCTGTAYATITGSDTVPDLRGAYLRMAGQNGSNQAWNGGTLNDWQEDTTARPKTAFTTNTMGNHAHNYKVGTGGYAENNNQNPIGLMRGDRNWTTGGLEGRTGAHFMNNDGNHAHNVAGGGDAETRPKTYSVNYFIKVN